MEILRAVPEDHTLLTALTKRSKAYWGYSPEQIQAWDVQLTVTADYISKNATFKLVDNGQVVGYYSLLPKEAGVQLDYLFIEPQFIGKGYGKLLMEHLSGYAAMHKISCITLDAEPYAEAFYARFGFITVGALETAIPGRFLPVMRKVL